MRRVARAGGRRVDPQAGAIRSHSRVRIGLGSDVDAARVVRAADDLRARALRSAAHPRALRYRSARLGAPRVRWPDRRNHSQLLRPHSDSDAAGALLSLGDGTHDEGHRRQRGRARHDRALCAVREHGDSQRRRLRRVRAGTSDDAVQRRDDQRARHRQTRRAERHRHHHRCVRAAGPRAREHQAPAGGRRPAARAVPKHRRPPCRARSAARIAFLGAVWDERADLYASAHCFVLGARKASFSILLLEALAAGLRVAAMPGEGSSKAGEHWSLAEMASSQSAADLSAAIARALAPTSPDYLSRARAMARRFDWGAIVPRIRRVYDEAVG